MRLLGLCFFLPVIWLRLVKLCHLLFTPFFFFLLILLFQSYCIEPGLDTLNYTYFINDLFPDLAEQLIDFFAEIFNPPLCLVLHELLVHHEGVVVGDPLVLHAPCVLEVGKFFQHLVDCGPLASLLRKALCHELVELGAHGWNLADLYLGVEDLSNDGFFLLVMPG